MREIVEDRQPALDVVEVRLPWNVPAMRVLPAQDSEVGTFTLADGNNTSS